MFRTAITISAMLAAAAIAVPVASTASPRTPTESQPREQPGRKRQRLVQRAQLAYESEHRRCVALAQPSHESRVRLIAYRGKRRNSAPFCKRCTDADTPRQG
jgi:hypothetical protein